MGCHNRGDNSCIYIVPNNQVYLCANSDHYLSYTCYLLFLSIIAIDPKYAHTWWAKELHLKDSEDIQKHNNI